MRGLLYPIIAGFVTWGAVQLKIYIEERLEENRAKKRISKPKEPDKLYDHKWDEDDSDRSA